MDKVFVGKIVNTHGIKGEFRIKSDFEKKESVFKIGNEVIIDNKKYIIASYRIHKGYDMITVEGLNDINLVIPFKGLNLFVERETLNLGENDLIYADLIDMNICLNNKIIGTVKDYTIGENPLLIVKGKKDFYIPLKGDFIINIDKNNNKIIVSEQTKDLIL